MGELYIQLINFAMAHDIGVRQEPLKPTQKPLSDSVGRYVVLNYNWPNKREIAFQLAHEIGHILDGDEGVYYYATDRSAQICEGDANRTALHILVPMYFEEIKPEDANLHQFMTDLAIPTWLEHEAYDVIADYYDRI